MQQDLPMPNTTEAMIEVTIPVGGREGKHTHPGALMVHVTSGAISLDYEGKPNITYKAGDTFFVEAGKVHEGINMGTVPAVGSPFSSDRKASRSPNRWIRVGLSFPASHERCSCEGKGIHFYKNEPNRCQMDALPSRAEHARRA